LMTPAELQTWLEHAQRLIRISFDPGVVK
jgi:hypothetical protein